MCTLPVLPSRISVFQKPDLDEDGAESGAVSYPASGGGAAAAVLRLLLPMLQLQGRLRMDSDSDGAAQPRRAGAMRCNSLPLLLHESKDRVVRSLAMAEEERQMPWYNHFETNHSNRATWRGNGCRVQDLQ